MTVTPAPENLTVAPETKFVPVTVTSWLVAPLGRELGLVDETVGAGPGAGVATVKHPLHEPDRPSGLVTVKSRVPIAASAATLTLAVN